MHQHRSDGGAPAVTITREERDALWLVVADELAIIGTGIADVAEFAKRRDVAAQDAEGRRYVERLAEVAPIATALGWRLRGNRDTYTVSVPERLLRHWLGEIDGGMPDVDRKLQDADLDARLVVSRLLAEVTR